MEKINLKAAKRKAFGRKVKDLRRQGIIPANIYGKKIKSEAIEVEEKEFRSVFSKAKETGLIELIVDSEKRPVLVHQVQYHPVTDKLVHVDFFQVDLKEKVTAKIPVVIIGEAPAVKEKIGVILNILTEIEVEALPADLPEKIEADVSKLSEVGQTLKVSSLSLSAKVKILADPAFDIVKVAPLVSKEAEKLAAEEAAAQAAAAAASAEVAAPEAGVQAGAPAAKEVKPAAEGTSPAGSPGSSS